MDVEYIVAIVVSSLFLILFFVFIGIYCRNRKLRNLQSEKLEQMYSDKNLVKMDYDFGVYDEETERIIMSKSKQDDQLTFDDVVPEEASNAGSLFQTVDTEGPEEITGNYKP